MKLLFDHIWGNTTSYDLFYSFPLAQLEQGDSPDDMLEAGWTPTDTYFYHLDELLWINVRSTRIKIDGWTWKKKHKRLNNNDVLVKFYPYDVEHPYMKQCDEIYEKYVAKRQYRDVTEHVVENSFNNKDYFLYFDKVVSPETLVAYSANMRFNRSALAGEFAWDWETPELQVGKFSVCTEVEHYKKMGIKYYYNSYAYQTICQYKANFNNFEWWTGREWSTDKALYKTVMAKDDTIKTLEDLHQWQKQYFETMKIK